MLSDATITSFDSNNSWPVSVIHHILENRIVHAACSYQSDDSNKTRLDTSPGLLQVKDTSRLSHCKFVSRSPKVSPDEMHHFNTPPWREGHYQPSSYIDQRISVDTIQAMSCLNSSLETNQHWLVLFGTLSRSRSKSPEPRIGQVKFLCDRTIHCHESTVQIFRKQFPLWNVFSDFKSRPTRPCQRKNWIPTTFLMV